MPLNAANFVQNGNIVHQDLMQFVNLLTGVMTDQPVTITNTVSASALVVSPGPSALTLGVAASGAFIATAVSGSLQFAANSVVGWYLDYSTRAWYANTDNAVDIGASSSHRPRTVYAATSFIGPGAVPTGGGAGQVLAKIDATNYNTNWITPSGGSVSWPLLAPDGIAAAPSYSFANSTGSGLYLNSGVLALSAASTLNLMAGATYNLQFWTGGVTRWRIDGSGMLTAVNDNAYDIGASLANRPRNLYIANYASVANAIGVGNNASSGSAIAVSGITLNTSITQKGISCQATFGSAVTNIGSVFQGQMITQAATFSMSNAYVFWAFAPTLGSGSSIGNLYGVYVQNQGKSGVTNAYGVYIEATSGATNTNIGLYNAGTTQLQGYVGIGTGPSGPNWQLMVQNNSHFNNVVIDNALGFAPDPSTMLILAGATHTGGWQWGIQSRIYFDSASTSGFTLFGGQITGNGGTYNVGQVKWFSVDSWYGGLPGGVTVGSAYGLWVSNVGTSGVTNAYGIYIQAQSGAASANVGLYNEGPSVLAGGTLIGNSGTPPASGVCIQGATPAVAVGLGIGITSAAANGGVTALTGPLRGTGTGPAGAQASGWLQIYFYNTVYWIPLFT